MKSEKNLAYKKQKSSEDMLGINSEHKLRSENLPFDIDVWYPRLKQMTYRSVFYPLTRSEAKAILNYQETRFNRRYKLTTADVKVLGNLEVELQNLLSNEFSARPAFMRLCGRSPKDGEPLNRQDVRDSYKVALERIMLEEKVSQPDVNMKLRAASSVQYLCVRSGEEAMALLLTSERVFTDLRDWLEYGEPEQICFREWDPEMQLEYEFRAYISNGKITAISQYDHYAVYPRLTSLVDKVKARILQKFKELHAAVGLASYVSDFLYHPTTDTVTLIEISPFRECTGSACFSWRVDGDQLRNGPFEFRLNTKQHPQLDALFENNWELRWAKEVPHYRTYYSAVLDKEEHNWKGWAWKAGLCTVSGIAIWGSPWMAIPIGFLGLAYLVHLGRSTREGQQHRLFVYGTLKRGFHWHSKFLKRARFVGAAETVDRFPLVVGASGVPYLLYQPGRGETVVGELYEVDDESLQNMDSYEGIDKEYYWRETVLVKRVDQGEAVSEAFMYAMVKPSEELNNLSTLREYTREIHDEKYMAMRHIGIKQQRYLEEFYGKTYDIVLANG